MKLKDWLEGLLELGIVSTFFSVIECRGRNNKAESFLCSRKVSFYNS